MQFREAGKMKVGDRVIVKRAQAVLTIEEIDYQETDDFHGYYFLCSDGEKHYHTTVQPYIEE